MTRDDESPLEFPCEFPIKAMGRSGQDLEATVRSIIREHAPEARARAARVSESRHGNYVAITLTITASSRAQLDAIYADLQAHNEILATL